MKPRGKASGHPNADGVRISYFPFALLIPGPDREYHLSRELRRTFDAERLPGSPDFEEGRKIFCNGGRSLAGHPEDHERRPRNVHSHHAS